MVFLFYKQSQSKKSQVHVQNPNTSKHNARVPTVTEWAGGMGVIGGGGVGAPSFSIPNSLSENALINWQPSDFALTRAPFTCTKPSYFKAD